MIDTDYKSLSEIDTEIVGFYAEDVRTRQIGYDEELEKPITEEYTVIVLNKPDTVPYSEVSKRKGERKSAAIVMAELERAITWEYFHVNHDLYIEWRDRPEPERARDEDGQFVSDDPETELNEAWVDGFSQADYDAQERPVIDMANRREHYKVIVLPPASDYYTILDTFDEAFNDESRTVTRTHHIQNKTTEEVADMHCSHAFGIRCGRIYEPVTFDLESGETVTIDVGVGKDGVKGIDNIKDALIDCLLTYRTTGESLTTEWIMSDNSVVTVTDIDLGNALKAFNQRKQKLFSQYAAWRSGDKQQEFTPTGI